MVLVANGQELIDTVIESFGIIAPGNVVQKNPHRVHPDALRIAQLAVNCCRIKCVGLPHFKLIDRSAGDKVGPTNQGWLAYQRLACSADQRLDAAAKVWPHSRRLATRIPNEGFIIFS